MIPGNHEPPHVHVHRAGAEITVCLFPFRVVKVRGYVSQADLRLARRIVFENAEVCLLTFREFCS